MLSDDQFALLKRWQRFDRMRDVMFIGICFFFGVYVVRCENQRQADLVTMYATIAALRSDMNYWAKENRRIIAMQREDPKAFPRVSKQFEEIDRYERINHKPQR